MTNQAFVIPAGRNWTIKTIVDNGIPYIWSKLAKGVTVVEHKYAHEGNGGHYNASVEWYGGKNWLIYECKVPQSVKQYVRSTLKVHGLKYDRVLESEIVSKAISDLYDYLGQIVSRESSQPQRSNFSSRIQAKNFYESLMRDPKYHAYKALVDKLACEQLEDYYKHVIGE